MILQMNGLVRGPAGDLSSSAPLLVAVVDGARGLYEGAVVKALGDSCARVHFVKKLVDCADVHGAHHDTCEVLEVFLAFAVGSCQVAAKGDLADAAKVAKSVEVCYELGVRVVSDSLAARTWALVVIKVEMERFELGTSHVVAQKMLDVIEPGSMTNADLQTADCHGRTVGQELGEKHALAGLPMDIEHQGLMANGRGE